MRAVKYSRGTNYEKIYHLNEEQAVQERGEGSSSFREGKNTTRRQGPLCHAFAQEAGGFSRVCCIISIPRRVFAFQMRKVGTDLPLLQR